MAALPPRALAAQKEAVSIQQSAISKTHSRGLGQALHPDHGLPHFWFDRRWSFPYNDYVVSIPMTPEFDARGIGRRQREDRAGSGTASEAFLCLDWVTATPEGGCAP